MPSEINLVPSFARDTAIAALVFAVVLAPTLYEIEPEILTAPGYILYIPLLFVYTILGGELENAHGPGLLEAAAFVLALAVLSAAVARVLRQQFGVSGGEASRYAVVALAAVGGTAAAILGGVALAGYYSMGTTTSVGLLVVGIAAIAASAWYAGGSAST